MLGETQASSLRELSCWPFILSPRMHLSVGPHLRCAGGNAVASAILMQICTVRSALPTDIMQFSLMNLPQDGVPFVNFSYINALLFKNRKSLKM